MKKIDSMLASTGYSQVTGQCKSMHRWKSSTWRSITCTDHVGQILSCNASSTGYQLLRNICLEELLGYSPDCFRLSSAASFAALTILSRLAGSEGNLRLRFLSMLSPPSMSPFVVYYHLWLFNIILYYLILLIAQRKSDGKVVEFPNMFKNRSLDKVVEFPNVFNNFDICFYLTPLWPEPRRRSLKSNTENRSLDTVVEFYQRVQKSLFE